jgi:uncharacterized protein (DUF2147 family)
MFMILRRHLTQSLFLSYLFWIGNACAQITPIGVWIASDEGGGSVEIEIYPMGADLAGKILSFSAHEKQSRRRMCTNCSDDRKGRPMIGLEIMRGIPANVAGPVWSGGNVLDPDTGKIYRLRLELMEDGRRMMVRGYLGPFYQTEIWERKSTVTQK